MYMMCIVRLRIFDTPSLLKMEPKPGLDRWDGSSWVGSLVIIQILVMIFSSCYCCCHECSLLFICCFVKVFVAIILSVMIIGLDCGYERARIQIIVKVAVREQSS